MNAHEAMRKYPTRVAVWIAVAPDEKNLHNLDRHKYLIERDMTMAQVVYIIRNKMVLEKSMALFVMVGDGVLPPSSASVGDMYEAHHDKDGYLYVTYRCERTFG